MTWGIWGVPDAELGALGDVDGLDVVELGCGTAYLSAVLAKQGARPVGVDITPAQLETARGCMAATGIEFPLVEADAGATGLRRRELRPRRLRVRRLDLDRPGRFLAESARLLRPGGRLVFLCGSTLQWLCTTADETVGEGLVRPQFGMRRLELDTEGVEFHVPHGERIRPLAPPRLPDRAPDRGAGARPTPRRIPTTATSPPTGRGSGRRKRSGSRTGSDAAADPARLDLAAALGDPEPACDPVRGRRTGVRGAGRRRPASSTPPARHARSTDPAGSCSASTRWCSAAAKQLGKPRDGAEARRMLERLSGSDHDVVSGLCLRADGWEELGRETTRVRFRALAPGDLDRYLASGEWHGRAGAYAIQGLGASLVERIEGDYLNVVGLPGALLVRPARRPLPGRVRLRLSRPARARAAPPRRTRRSIRRAASGRPVRREAAGEQGRRTRSTSSARRALARRRRGGARAGRAGTSRGSRPPRGAVPGPSSSPDGAKPDERRVDEARPGEHEHEVRQRARVLDPDPVDERVGGDRGGDRRDRENRASRRRVPSGPRTSTTPPPRAARRRPPPTRRRGRARRPWRRARAPAPARG